jgi:hypothetical protein
VTPAPIGVSANAALNANVKPAASNSFLIMTAPSRKARQQGRGKAYAACLERQRGSHRHHVDV